MKLRMKLVAVHILSRYGIWRIRKLLLTLALFGVTLFALSKSFNYTNHISRSWRSMGAKDRLSCRLPKLDVSNPLVNKYFHDVPPLDCDQEENWVCVKDGFARVCEPFQKLHPRGVVGCNYRFIERSDDHTNHVAIVVKNATSAVKLVSDFFYVDCVLYEDGTTKTWHNLMCGIADRGKQFTDARPFPHNSMNLNVLFFGFDSLSHMTFVRKLPKSYEYLSNALGAVVLNGYNIVGDGTPQALIPIFTGFTELELPETRKRMGDRANYVNIYPFIWNDYRQNGYVTAYTEDMANIGTFTYRLKGFADPPTDHYGRPFYLEMDKVYSEYRKLCFAGTPRHKVFFNYIEDFFDSYVNRPKFFFGFHAELSHDNYNLVGLADDDLLAFLTSLKRKKHLDNTLLIVMSDHGHRFAEFRETQQGKQEERLPFFSFVFPPNFKTNYPKEWANINANVDRLTSPFDIYPTLKDILYYPGNEVKSNEGNSSKDRSISLFKQIPVNRNCEDAGIEPHWCTCLRMETVPLNDPIANKVGNALVDFINNLLLPQKSLCHQLQLQNITRLEKHIPHADLLKYKKNSDYDGFVGDFTDNTEVTIVIYHIKIVTTPGDGHFESSLTYNSKTDKLEANERSISRVNQYGNAPHCVAHTHHHLLKYCYCKEQLQPLQINN